MTEKRSIFDWMMFLFIHIVVIGGISVAGFYVYGWRLGVWVAASATVAGFASMYLFAKEVPGETVMKCWLGLCVALNAAYIVHNGAKGIGIEAYNSAQVDKFQKGMEEAGKASSRKIARELRLGAENASKLELAFSDGVALIAAVLAFLELASALMIFAISSRRLKAETRGRELMAMSPPSDMPYARHMPRLRPGMAPAQARADTEETPGKESRR